MSSTSDAVRTAANPQAALLAVAEGIDRILERLEELESQPVADGWGEWNTEAPAFVDTKPASKEPPFTIEIGDGATEISFVKPSSEKAERRKLFAQAVLHLDEQGLEVYGIEDPFDVYSKGGPLWLYHGNRDLFMSYGPEVRALMVMDIEEDDPSTAHEVGRDVLKDDEGLTKTFVMEAINGSTPD